MNGVRTIFTRKGYLLTALAAAVLLAASPGIASAQKTIQFTAPGGAVDEGADNSSITPGPDALQLSITVGGLPADDPMTNDTNERTASLGSVTIDGGSALTFQDSLGATVDVTSSLAGRFARSDTLTLFVYQTATSDGNWKDEKYDLKLSAGGTTGSPVRVTRDVFTVTVNDADVAPVAKFKHVNAPNISLQESSTTEIKMVVEVGSMTATKQGAMSAVPPISIASSVASTKIGNCGTTAALAGHILDIESPSGTNAEFDATTGTWALTGGETANEGTTATYNSLFVTACPDSGDFRDAQVMLSFVAKTLASGTNGADGTLADGGGVTITVDSNEETPTVSFSTSDINVDEGGTQTLYLVADTKQGGEVGMADIMVSGEARIELTGDNVTAGDDVDDYGNGTYTVEFGTSANTKVTVSAMGDESLGDGETAMGMLKITDANDAMIGDDNTVSVTVRGSTSVPALPLVGQLLLALFLMAGGSRLYRRRRG